MNATATGPIETSAILTNLSIAAGWLPGSRGRIEGVNADPLVRR